MEPKSLTEPESKPLRAIYRDAGNNKGFGLFAPCDIAPGERIYKESGVAFPLATPFRRPWELQPGFDNFSHFQDWMQLVSGHMSMLRKLYTTTWAKTIGGLDYPEDIEECFSRKPNGSTYSMDFLCEALLGWLSGIREHSPDLAHRADLDARYSARGVQRFLEDSLFYVVYDEPVDVACIFGLMTGLVNHACFPNAILSVQGSTEIVEGRIPLAVTLTLTACKPIKKGDEITISYVFGVPPRVREHRAQLLHFYKFNCRCYSCVNEGEHSHILGVRDALRELIVESQLQTAGQVQIPLKILCNKARWMIDASEELGCFDMELLATLRGCSSQAEGAGDLLRACYFLYARVEMMRTYMPGSSHLHTAERKFEEMCNEWNIPEVHRLCTRLYNIDKGHEDDVDYQYVTDRIFMMSQHPADDKFKTSEENEELREIVLGFEKVNKRVQDIKKDLKEDTTKLLALAEAANKQAKTVKNQKRKSRARRNRQRQSEQDEVLIESETEREDSPPSESPRDSFISQEKVDVVGEGVEPSDTLDSRSPILPRPAASQCLSLRNYTYPTAWIAPLAAEDRISKQVWCSSRDLQQSRPFAPRDIEHLLAAKDGLGSKHEGFGLKMRRDSACGRMEGDKEFLDLERVFGRRCRAHSFGNDAGKKDLLKEAEV